MWRFRGDALSSSIYCLCTDPILQIIAKKYEIIAYADDILIGIDDNANVDDTIQEVLYWFSLIGNHKHRFKHRFNC